VHPKGKEPRTNPDAVEYLKSNSQYAPRATLQERMVLLMVNEAARCLEEQIVTEAADVDFAMIMGTGFAPFRGGPLRYADALGISKAVDSMKKFADAGAPYFAPCSLLRSMVADGKKFYEK
jgi:3-hydroxyacyl-CoA dehydrogenase